MGNFTIEKNCIVYTLYNTTFPETKMTQIKAQIKVAFPSGRLVYRLKLGDHKNLQLVITEHLFILQSNTLTSDQMSCLLSRRVELLQLLRPNAIALVDSFDYPDRILNSCLGRYDGQVYEALYEYAKSSSLNQYQVS